MHPQATLEKGRLFEWTNHPAPVGKYWKLWHSVNIHKTWDVMGLITRDVVVFFTWWLIPLSKWVITPVINGISRVNPLIIGVISHLLSGMSHQVTICEMINYGITMGHILRLKWDKLYQPVQEFATSHRMSQLLPLPRGSGLPCEFQRQEHRCRLQLQRRHRSGWYMQRARKMCGIYWDLLWVDLGRCRFYVIYIYIYIMGLIGISCGYALVVCYIAMENGSFIIC